MKKIMWIENLDYYIDISTPKMLNNTYKWIYKKFIKEHIERDIKCFRYMTENCTICNHSGSVKIKGIKFTCPNCNGKCGLEKRDISNINDYKKTEEGDLKALKRIVNRCKGDWFEIYSVRTIKD